VPSFARAHKGETIDELAARLYRAADAETGMKAAVEGLLEANRHLRLKGRGRAKTLEDDGFVIVPEVEGAAHDRRATAPISKAAARTLLKRTMEGIEVLQPGLENARREAVQELEQTLELAESEPLRTAAEADPDLATRLDSVRDWTKRRIEEVERAHQARRAAVERAAKTLTELLERAGA